MLPFVRGRITCIATLSFLLSLFAPLPAQAAEYYDQYNLAPASPELDLGIQPHGYPSGVVSAVMRRDRLMLNALARLSTPLKTHPFQRGADMLPLLADQRLEAGLLGDVPTILAAAQGDVWIVGLVKQTSTSIVAKEFTQVRQLAGKRIGYVETSSAHHTLLQGLSSAGLSESDVKLVALRIDEMPDALEARQIDAFAAWEPAPTAALANNPQNRTVFRGLSSDYFRHQPQLRTTLARSSTNTNCRFCACHRIHAPQSEKRRGSSQLGNCRCSGICTQSQYHRDSSGRRHHAA
jgi:ABC-type nitrate/sulfonate/bicarbonate transport system substrate-binding protein